MMTAVSDAYRRRTISARRWLALALAVLIILTGGVLYGNYVQRWSPPAELSAAASQLAKLPREIGSWKAVEDIPIDESALAMLECAGYVHRSYVNQNSGQSVQFVIIVGRPGPIAVHTPEICFSSRAYAVKNERSEITVDTSPNEQHSFWKIDFAPRNGFAQSLRVYYAWSPNRVWKAARSPRFEFAGLPLLYKIQLATYISPLQGDEGPDPGQQFLEELLRTL